MKVFEVGILRQLRRGQPRDGRFQSFLGGGPVCSGDIHQRRIQRNRRRRAAGKETNERALDQKGLSRGQNRGLWHESILAIVNQNVRPRAALFNQSDVIADDVAHFSVIWQALKNASAHYCIIPIGATQFAFGSGLDVVDIFLPPDHKAVRQVRGVERRIRTGAAGYIPLMWVGSGHYDMSAHQRQVVEGVRALRQFLGVAQQVVDAAGF